MKSSPLRHPARLAGASLLRLQSDARLAELAVSGHEAAFDAIVDRYRTPLARYCAGIVGPSRAEDAVQQALINAHDALQRTDEVRHLRSWLYRIAHNASLNVLRAVRDDVPLEDVSLSAAESGGPAESFERSERFRATVAALQELPERQRAALLLRELEGRSHEEIANALGVTKGSARQHLMRARVAVRGAVTAITPYPLIARLAETLTSAGGGAGWADAAVGAGAGATLAKLTAGVAATGALVGGAVGGSHVVHHGGGAEAGAAVTREAAAEPKRAVKAVSAAAGAVAVTPATLTPAGDPAPKQAARAPKRHATKEQDHRSPARRHVTPQPSPSSTAGPSDEASAAHREHHRNRGHSGRDADDDAARHGSRSSGKDDRSGSPGRHRGRDRDDQHGSAAEPTAGSHSESSGKGRDKHERDAAKPTATTPATTTPGDQTSGSGSSGSGSGSDGSTDSVDSDSSSSGSGPGEPKPTDSTESAGITDATPSGTATTGG